MSNKQSVEKMEQLIAEKKKKSAEQGFWKKKKREANHPARKK